MRLMPVPTQSGRWNGKETTVSGLSVQNKVVEVQVCDLGLLYGFKLPRDHTRSGYRHEKNMTQQYRGYELRDIA